MTTTNVHSMLERAIKSMLTTSALGDSILVPEQRDRFLAALETRAPLLGEARRILMASHSTNIDRWTIGEVLEAPAAEGTAFTGSTAPETATNKLVSVKVRGRVPASDESLADSLARGDAAQQLVDLIASRSGVDLERLFVNGDATEGSGLLGLTNGWLVKAANAIEGDDDPGAGEFDENDVEDMFEQMLLTLDPRFLTQRDRLRFWVPFAAENDYRNVLRARGTELGDAAQIGNRPLSYKGVRIVEVPNMPGGSAMLSSIDNVVYGVWQDIEIEPERVASADRTDFHVRARVDCHFEDENGAVVATGYAGPAVVGGD